MSWYIDISICHDINDLTWCHSSRATAIWADKLEFLFKNSATNRSCLPETLPLSDRHEQKKLQFQMKHNSYQRNVVIRNHVIRCIFSSCGDIEVSTYTHLTMRNCNICTLLGVSCTCVYKVVNIVHCNWSNRWGLAEGIITKCVLTVPVTQGSFQEVTEWYLTGNYMVSSGYQVTSTMVSKNIQEYPE